MAVCSEGVSKDMAITINGQAARSYGEVIFLSFSLLWYGVSTVLLASLPSYLELSPSIYQISSYLGCSGLTLVSVHHALKFPCYSLTRKSRPFKKTNIFLTYLLMLSSITRHPSVYFATLCLVYHQNTNIDELSVFLSS